MPTWQQIFDRPAVFFRKWKIPFENKQKLLYDFSTHEFSFIGFGFFPVNFGAFLKFWRNPEIRGSGSKMATIGNHDVISRSYADLKYYIFGPTISPSLMAESFPQRGEKGALDRVKRASSNQNKIENTVTNQSQSFPWNFFFHYRVKFGYN